MEEGRERQKAQEDTAEEEKKSNIASPERRAEEVKEGRKKRS